MKIAKNSAIASADATKILPFVQNGTAFLGEILFKYSTVYGFSDAELPL